MAKKSENPQTGPEERAGRRSLRPLAMLWPYVGRHRGMVALTAVALVTSAMAMLALPMGVRRMIDLGFSAENSEFIDKYFAMMMLIGLVLAVASATRFYAVNWLGERVVADLRRSAVPRPPTDAGRARIRERRVTGPADRPGRAELLAELDALPIPERLSLGDLRARRRRRRVRRGATAMAGILAVVGIAAGVITSLPSDDHDVEIAAYPEGVLAPVEPADPVVEPPTQAPGPWVWKPSPNLATRDGSSSGVALRHVDGSTDLMLYLLDGPACPEPAACSERDTDYGMAEFAADTAEDGRLNQGVFDPDDGYFRHWNIVAVPHATGDLFRGRSPDPRAVPGESDRNFVGEQNLTRILRSLSGSVEQESIERIAIAGSGVAGLGVYGAVDVFGEVVPGIEPIAVIDGAPLPVSDRLPSTCVREQWGETWNTTLPAGWSEVVPTDAAGLSGYYTYLDDRHRAGRFALVATTVPGAVAALLGDQSAGCVAATSPTEADWPRLVDDLAGEVATLDSWLVTTMDQPDPALTSTTLTAADTHALHALLDRLLETP